MLLACVVLVAGGCARWQPAPTVMLADLIAELGRPERIARLDAWPAAIVTSCDPAGSNEDYNRFLRKGPPGWVVIADLKGPGYVSRFWFTGAENGRHGLRLYFDGERQPTLDTTVGAFCGGRAPYLPPLAVYENFCWYSWIPVPYARRLVIMVQEPTRKEGSGSRLFYQVNSVALPPGQYVASFTGNFTAAEERQLAAVAEAWQHPVAALAAGAPSVCATNVTLAPGEKWSLPPLTGPGMIRTLEVTPDFASLPTAVARERLLRDVVVRLGWNGSVEPSVLVPLGDFFGSAWRRTRYASFYFGLTNNTFACRFPMPFQQSAAIGLDNQGALPVRLAVRVAWEPLAAWDTAWGYFHATWSRTRPEDTGRPHPILHATGRGRYAGCLLAVTSQDRSWWILEGDESMRVDGELTPRWRGTGLEDYFNGGWYYQNVMSRPLNGVPFKSFFRIVQYRLHRLDPVMFRDAFDMLFERGPDHASHGAMESTAYYYLDHPAPAAFSLPPAAERVAPADPLAEPSVMTELLNAERLGDDEGAREYIDQFLEEHPRFPFAPLLRLRQIAYLERRDGIAQTRPLYERFMAETKDARAREQARLLLWFHEADSNALLAVYATAPTRVFLDGRDVGGAAAPERVELYGLNLGRGSHALALNTRWSPYPAWVQAGLRTHRGLIGTQPDWKHAFRPSGGWSAADYDDRGWAEVGGTGVKGPPEEPHVWLEPNALIDVQSATAGLRAEERDWLDRQSFFVFRKSFFH